MDVMRCGWCKEEKKNEIMDKISILKLSVCVCVVRVAHMCVFVHVVTSAHVVSYFY